MKHWIEGKTRTGYGPNGIKLVLAPSDYGDDRILSLAKGADGKVTFREECDGYYSATASKDVAVEALREAIAWIDAT